MNKKNGLKIVSILAVVVLIISAAYMYALDSSPDISASAESNQALTLTHPMLSALATTYLELEAGISIYVNTTGPLNLNSAKSAMVNIENETSDYVIGSVAPSGFSSDDYPHCFVHKDGWIIVYYLKINPQNPATTGWLGKIIDWGDTSQISFPITSNLLYDGLYHIATVFGISMTGAKYYHFQYPDATEILFAIKHAEQDQTATFNVKIPDTITVHERSWSCFSVVPTNWDNAYTFKIDSTEISKSSGGRHYGGSQITETILGLNIFHTISIYTTNYNGNSAYVCLILLYH